MAQNSKIEWTDHTFNPWEGCTKVSAACDNCYAEARAKRFGTVTWGNAPRRRTSKSLWREPLKWNRRADTFEAEHGHRQRVFCASLADVFDNQVDPQWRADLFDLIRVTPRLDWLLLTKRPQNIRKMLPTDWGQGWPHVWLGCTTEDQTEFDRRWPSLASIPAAVRFISYEPALAPLVLPDAGTLPDWVICGGESKQGKDEPKPMNPQWARDIRDQCARLGIAFFFKQWGDIRSNPLVSEIGMPINTAKATADKLGRGGGMLDRKLYHAWPTLRRLARKAA